MKHFLKEAEQICGTLALCGALICAAVPLRRPCLQALCSAACAGREITTIYTTRRRHPPRPLIAATAALTLTALVCALLQKKPENSF